MVRIQTPFVLTIYIPSKIIHKFIRKKKRLSRVCFDFSYVILIFLPICRLIFEKHAQGVINYDFRLKDESCLKK